MPNFSKTSLGRLKECHADIQTIFIEVIKYFDCIVICGHRSKEDQNHAFATGKSKLRYPASKHNKVPALAADVVPYPVNWKDINRMQYFAGYVQATARQLYKQGKISHLIRWGGDWDNDTELSDNKFQDFPHFELVKP